MNLTWERSNYAPEKKPKRLASIPPAPEELAYLVEIHRDLWSSGTPNTYSEVSGMSAAMNLALEGWEIQILILLGNIHQRVLS